MLNANIPWHIITANTQSYYKLSYLFQQIHGIMPDNMNKLSTDDTDENNRAATTVPQSPPNDIDKQIHPLQLIKASDALSACLRSLWIENVEQAVAYLASIHVEIDGKEAFLAQARDILGEETYGKYAKPVPRRPLGCIANHTEEHFMKQAEDTKSEYRLEKGTP